MRIVLIDAARRGPMRDGEISWAKTYEKRMRRFNFEIILFALVSLVIDLVLVPRVVCVFSVVSASGEAIGLMTRFLETI